MRSGVTPGAGVDAATKCPLDTINRLLETMFLTQILFIQPWHEQLTKHEATQTYIIMTQTNFTELLTYKREVITYVQSLFSETITFSIVSSFDTLSIQGNLILSVLRHIFIFILLIVCRFDTASETHVWVEIVQTLAINLLTSIDPS